MKLTLKELNEIYYCLNKVSQVKDNAFINYELVEQIRDKVRDEIDMMEYENESNEDDADEDYKASLMQDEQRYENQHK
jgi:hypothetical protein